MIEANEQFNKELQAVQANIDTLKRRYENIKNKKDYGKKNNYIIIFGATEQGSILYGQEKKDLY